MPGVMRDPDEHAEDEMRVLVVNAGSSTLKLEVVEADRVEAEVHLDEWAGDDPSEAFERLLEASPAIDAIGHRIVHGGRRFTRPVVIDAEVDRAIEDLQPLAPLHQPRAVVALRRARKALPAPPHVACFDTAFHATMPAAARTYALPKAWRERWGLDRHGFHGFSHASAARRGPELANRAHPGLRVIGCHLGAGASLCATIDGRSIDTTMGFTPLEGLVMSTRCGSIDPGLLLWLITDAGLAAADVMDGLELHSGLAGLSGTDGDMREVLARQASGDPEATLAFDVYTHRLRREIAAMAAATHGLDVLVFTGGIGERSAAVRAAAGDGLAFLGVQIDADANIAARGDADTSAAGAPAATVVVRAREDLEVARQVRDLFERDGDEPLTRP